MRIAFTFLTVLWSMILAHAAFYCTTLVDSPYTFSLLHLGQIALSPLALVLSMYAVNRAR